MQNYNGVDPLAEWCAKEMRLNIDGKLFVIKPTMEHYRKLRSLMKNQAESEFNQEDVFKEILETTFPNSSSVQDFLDRYEQKFQIALMAEIVGIPQEELKKKLFQTVGNQKGGSA